VRHWLFRLLLLAVLAAAGFWGWHVLFPRPEQVIRQRLAELARLASIAPNETPLARLLNSQKLGNYFTPDVEVTVDVPGESRQTFQGREDLLQAAAGARSTLHSLKVEFLDVSVALGADRRSAVAHFTVKADLPGEHVPQVQELKARFRKTDNGWLIDHAETVQTLRQP
jgi:hypothetical protein